MAPPTENSGNPGQGAVPEPASPGEQTVPVRRPDPALPPDRSDPDGAGVNGAGVNGAGASGAGASGAGASATGSPGTGSGHDGRVALRPTVGLPAASVAVGAPLLEVDRVTLRFGGVVALDDVSFTLAKGEIFGLIGPNGAGKTTCFNAMTGVYAPTSGSIRFAGDRVSGRKKYDITRLGIARTFQNIRLFPEMTALENVMVGADSRHHTSVVGALLRLPRHWREERAAREKSLDLLEFVGIRDRAHVVARNLSYGEQRRLEIARALATDPTLLCLDEPAAGFNPAEKESLLGLIRKIRDHGVTVLLIEHDMRLVMGVCDRIVVLEFGRKIAEGTPAQVRDDPKVIAAYLGEPADVA